MQPSRKLDDDDDPKTKEERESIVECFKVDPYSITSQEKSEAILL